MQATLCSALTKIAADRQLEGSRAMMTEPLEEQNRNLDPVPAAGDDCPPKEDKHDPHARGLLVIGVFKLSKALFFIAVGAGALHLVHRDVGDVFQKIATTLRLDPESRLFAMLSSKADLISHHQLRNVVKLSWGYAALSLVEGVGLMMQKTWAEYLTLTLTICALPWDMTELVKHPDPIHWGVVLINVAVLAYLLWFIWWHRRQKRLHR
ncbi:MAG TPA: DUF2127 domain-containing protein [Acidobacteriaceae bacterium]|nr:DUF2127 domain-containing protein [Acidobacteriaceae bacterium]